MALIDELPPDRAASNTQVLDDSAEARANDCLPGENVEKLFQCGVSDLQHGKYQEAVRHFTAALGLDPANPALLSHRGDAFRLLCEYQRALADFQAAVRLSPSDPALLVSRARVYCHSGAHQQAIADCDMALAARPNLVAAYHVRAVAWDDAGAHDRALADWSAVIELAPKDSEAYYRRGLIHARKRDYALAAADFDRSLELNPYHIRAYLERGHCRRWLGSYAQAINDYSEVPRHHPTHALAYVGRGLAYRFSRDPGRALADFNEALRLDPANPQAHHQRGLLYRARGDLERARIDLDEALERQPENWAALYYRGKISLAQGQFALACTDLTQALLLNPKLVAGYLSRALAYDHLGQFEEAFADATRSIELDTNSAAAHLVRGVVHAHSGQLAAACADLTEAIRLDDRLALAFRERSLVHALRGNQDQALADCNRLLALEPGNAQVYAARSIAYYSKGQVQQALTDYARALQIDPKCILTGWSPSLAAVARGQTIQRLADYIDGLRAETPCSEATPPPPFQVVIEPAGALATRPESSSNDTPEAIATVETSKTSLSRPRRMMPTLLVIDDEPNVLYSLSRGLGSASLHVDTALTARQGLERLQLHRPDAVLLDVRLPDMNGLEAFEKIRQIDPRLPVVLMTAFATTETAIEAMKLGAFEYLIKPLDFHQLQDVVARALELSRSRRVPAVFTEVEENGLVDRIVGRCPAMQEVYKAIGRVAPLDVPVLIIGESGTGKELVARALYQHSRRKEGPFLTLNCAAIPETLLESELFGNERGAFTSADRRRIGKFEQANHGTIFLDEIGDMSLATQPKVLRLLQEQSFERVGGNETIATDVRIIAATNQDLEELVAASTLRQELYYRLKVYTIGLPPLRERPGDLPLLVDHFLSLLNRELGKRVSSVAPEPCCWPYLSTTHLLHPDWFKTGQDGQYLATRADPSGQEELPGLEETGRFWNGGHGKPVLAVLQHVKLVLPMESCPEDIDRASVPVERRVSEELVVDRQPTALCEGKIIIGFHRLLAVVAQVAVAIKNAGAPGLQEGLLLRRSTDQVTENTEGVAGTVPGGAFNAHAQLYRPVRVGKHRRRNMTVLPANSTERAEVRCNLLFPIQAKAVFVMEAEGGPWHGYFHSLRSIRRRRGGEQKTGRCAIAGKVAVVRPRLKPDRSGMTLDAPTALELQHHSPLFPKLPVGRFLPRLDRPHKDPIIGGETVRNAGQLKPSVA
jgi:DNA-binding NtrC family response regulator/tetratricopeptide (TPR) repeat protein